MTVSITYKLVLIAITIYCYAPPNKVSFLTFVTKLQKSRFLLSLECQNLFGGNCIVHYQVEAITITLSQSHSPQATIHILHSTLEQQ